MKEIITKEFQTPIVFYENPSTKRKVVVITTRHFANREYFDAIQKQIEILEKEGHQILCEHLKDLTPEVEKSLSPKELLIWRKLRDELGFGIDKAIESMKIISCTLPQKFDHEKFKLSIKENWIKHDASMLDLIKMFSATKEADNLLEENKASDKVFDTRFSDKDDIISNKENSESTNLFSDKNCEDIILHYRDQIAIEGIVSCLLNGNVTIVRGQDHLLGISKYLLTIIGFEEVRRTFLKGVEIAQIRNQIAYTEKRRDIFAPVNQDGKDLFQPPDRKNDPFFQNSPIYSHFED
ncbi:MAG: hypothetical protein HY445_00860 [Candidatus Niyogibacteria bacterium]|nr:hypothetical protein [Candidatus Niyogibacteria bacterium]